MSFCWGQLLLTIDIATNHCLKDRREMASVCLMASLFRLFGQELGMFAGKPS